jgi:hypothetical protein
MEPVVQMLATNRWQPLKHGTFAFENWYNPFNWHKPRFSEFERMEMQIENKDAENGLRALKRMQDNISSDSSYDGLVEIVNERQIALKALVNGAVATHRIPLELLTPAEESPGGPILPQVTLAAPDKLAIETDSNGNVKSGFTTEVVLTGADLDRISGLEIVVGRESAELVSWTHRGPGAVEITLKMSKAEGPLLFRLHLDPALTGLGTEASPLSLLSPPVYLLARKPTATAEVPDDFAPRTANPTGREGEPQRPAAMLNQPPEQETTSPLFPQEPTSPVPSRPIPATNRTAARGVPVRSMPELTLDAKDLDLPMPK